MNTRQYGLFGIAALALALAAPAQAAPEFPHGLIILVKKDRDDREARRDDRYDDRRALRRDDREDAYGIGYERRKQKRDERGDDEGDRRRRP